MQYDIAIIGGGTGGYVAAIKAAQMGKKTCIIEKQRLGGTCLNVGCIPTKILLRSVEALKEVKNSAVFGVINADVSNASLDLKKVQERKKTVTNQLVDGINILLLKNKVEIIQEEAKLINKHTIKVADKEITAENIILATGSTPKELNIKIDEEADIITSAEALDMDEIPKDIVIIGGGVIGIEFAYFLSSIGTKVTIVEFLDRILPMVDEEITDLVSNQLSEMGIEVLTSAKVTEIKEDKVIFEKDGNLKEIKTNKVLMAVGRTPNVKNLNLEEVGVNIKKGAIFTDERLQTNIAGIYAIGDVNGKAMLAHTASMEGIIAVENICGKDSKIDYSKIPSAIYIQPEVASVGLTEAEAKTKYDEIKVGRFPLIGNGKAKVAGDDRGLVKVIANSKYNEIVGVHMYCVHATDMISEATLAMNLECTAEEIAKSIHPHPTISEVIHEACHAVLGKAIHL